MINDISLFKELLKNISVKEINERISRFRNFISIKNISEDYLNKEIMNIFLSKLNDNPFRFFYSADTQMPPYHKYYFYRIRKFNEKDMYGLGTGVFSSMRTKQDLLWVPDEYCKIGRLNRDADSVLYVSTTSTNTIYETRLKEGDFFFLIIYENKKPLRLSQIHLNQYFEEFDELENAKISLLHNFLLNEFIKYVPKGREYLYKSSILIYENFFKSNYRDAFGYPSIATEEKLGMNLCFTKEKAIECLNISGVMVCELMKGNESSVFTMKHYYDGFLENDVINFYGANSEESKIKFGNFINVREMGL
ncbi:hypothetical protein E27107_10065 [Elizabethkingia anophelis]|nr:hypothetical protein E18064_440055 [Elizabethkingia anophelis]CDN76663.1 hypothetical protein E27107_10065 [Elizabethkingia anophelis]